jgi:hypothetical protein
MQMMFQTMNLNQTPQNRPKVVIDSSEVDFFSNTQESTVKQTQPQAQIDFFSDINTQPTQVLPQTTQPKMADYNTMQYMFATNQGMNNNNIQSAFGTSNPQKNQQWNTQSNPQSVNMGTNMGGLDMNTGINMNAGNNGLGMNTTLAMNTGIDTGINSGINMNTGLNLGTSLQSQSQPQ